MVTMDDPSKKAVALFNQNFNCAQSVFAAFAAQLGLDRSTMLKMASPFGGGVARRGQVCGVLTGGLMALGLAQGADSPAGKEEAYRLGQDFIKRFEALHKSILCRELLGYDISTIQGHQQARDSGAFTTLCPQFVRHAAEIVQDMLEKKP
jgi:C_GCAxxG_C_C family probable redox protein